MIKATRKSRDRSGVARRLARCGIADDPEGQPSAGPCETLALGACSAPINAHTRSKQA
ncbi:hypothetical protein ThimaDRAFT_0766 [Thiocapsa marina 5811]|uniref:Uncharacterized protein n=1 Tax=Thiocapsa marina 5811 TaxID=768671 RepID=F9U764_9GAMM|nr:hypothetical protein ThimaDRAFT_0766 [Thiocapsa marina 5811]